jgi:TRAP-type C4-dicarboxylate transport system permease small subunit
MDLFRVAVVKISRILNMIAGVSLIALMVLTIVDVILRGFARPVPGTYELVALLGALTIGLAMPQTALNRGHIYVDSLIASFPRTARNLFHLVTRCVVLILFFLVGWNLLRYGADLHRSGEVSLTLQIPFYPVAYGIGLACFVQCLVTLCEIAAIQEGKYDG